jgi:hypothetical protein
MPIDPIKIPQNVYIEDRIVGPLTLKQVLICAVGGGFSYALFASISKTYGGIGIPLQILVWLPAALSAVFAFIRINDLSMMRLCLLFLERMNKPAVRTWTPRRGIIINVRTFHTVPESKESKMSLYVDKKTEKIDELSTVLDLQAVETMPRVEPDAQDTNDDFATLMNEPFKEEPISATDNPNVIRRPVNPQRISASANAGNTVDGIVPKTCSISIFRDISPA